MTGSHIMTRSTLVFSVFTWLFFMILPTNHGIIGRKNWHWKGYMGNGWKYVTWQGISTKIIYTATVSLQYCQNTYHPRLSKSCLIRSGEEEGRYRWQSGEAERIVQDSLWCLVHGVGLPPFDPVCGAWHSPSDTHRKLLTPKHMRCRRTSHLDGYVRPSEAHTSFFLSFSQVTRHTRPLPWNSS